MTRQGYMLAIIASFVSAALADTVLLTNGNDIEGIISSETDEVILLDLGVGSMKIRKSRIKEIIRSDAEQRQDIERDWKKKHILHSRHVPRGLESLAKEFKNLEGARASATKTAARQSALREKIKKNKQDIEKLLTEHLQVNDELQWMEPAKDPAKYNSMVARNNTLSSTISLKYAELETWHKEIGEAERGMAAYLNSLAAFEASFEKAATGESLASVSPDHATFFTEMEKRLIPLRSEHKSHSIIVMRRGGSALVPAVINKSHTATLVLDTGASTVTLSRAFADRLKLDLSKARKTRVTLADGKTVQAHEIILGSVSVGTASANGVETVVLPTQPAAGVDGLLGMSFLGRFRINLDGGGRSLRLEELVLGKQ